MAALFNPCLLTASLFLLLGNEAVNAFYFDPKSYSVGDSVTLKVNSLTSTKTQLPINYYQLPFCHPEGGIKMENENLGQLLASDRIESSPYKLFMLRNISCAQVCVANLGVTEKKGMAPNRVVRHIRNNYHNNWIVDNLPSASKMEEDNTTTTRFWQGFPIGFVGSDRQAYIHNHVNLEIQYHRVETDADKFRIVRFIVEPFSIAHKFEDADSDEAPENGSSEQIPVDKYKILNPIDSCKKGSKKQTSYEMVIATKPQLASGSVLFTYDVIWTENEELKWASRWDVYLTMDNAIPSSVHWLSIANSWIFVLVLLTFVLRAVLNQNIKEATPENYEELARDEEDHFESESDTFVFSPPSAPLLLAACCGTGAQLLFAAVLTIILSAANILTMTIHGSIVAGFLSSCLLTSFVGGYVAARLYKTFGGQCWKDAGRCIAFGFPTLVFVSYFLFDIIAWSSGSTSAIPFGTMVEIICFWLTISSICGYGGAYLGYGQLPLAKVHLDSAATSDSILMPFTTKVVTFGCLAGIIPYSACFVELYFVLNSIWIQQYYCTFGFLLLCTLATVVLTAETTVLFVYFQLKQKKSPIWWWSSFYIGGSVAMYILLYSWFMYSRHLGLSLIAAHLVYFGYMGLFSLGIFLMLGFVGLASSMFVNKVIYEKASDDE